MAAPKLIKEAEVYKLVLSPTPSFEVSVPLNKREMIDLAYSLKDALEELKGVDIPNE